MRREIIIVITMFALLLMGANYAITYAPLNDLAQFNNSTTIIIYSFAMPLAAITLTIRKIKDMQSRARQWQFGLLTIGSMLLFLLIGLGLGTGHDLYGYIYDNVLTIIIRASTATWGLYLTASIYRSYRARSLETMFMAITMFAVLWNSAPFGGVISPELALFGTWCYDVLQLGGIRGITVATAIGAFGGIMRTALGQERGATSE